MNKKEIATFIAVFLLTTVWFGFSIIWGVSLLFRNVSSVEVFTWATSYFLVPLIVRKAVLIINPTK